MTHDNAENFIERINEIYLGTCQEKTNLIKEIKKLEKRHAQRIKEMS